MPSRGRRVQVGRWGLLAALLLAVAGCDAKQSAPVQGEAPSPAPGSKEAPAQEGVADSAPAPTPRVFAVVDGNKVEPVPLEELKTGLNRAQLLASAGECLARVKVITPTADRRSLEVFQPKDQDCQKRLGERHFVVVGDKLASIEPGLRPTPKPASPSNGPESSELPR